MLSGHRTRTSVFTTARGGLNISFSRFLRHQVCDDVLGRSGISHTGRWREGWLRRRRAVSFVTGAEKVGLEAQKASSRLRQEGVSHTAVEPWGGRQMQVKLGDEVQGRAEQPASPPPSPWFFWWMKVDQDRLRSALTRTLRCRQHLLPSEPEEHVTRFTLSNSATCLWFTEAAWVWTSGDDAHSCWLPLFYLLNLQRTLPMGLREESAPNFPSLNDDVQQCSL